MFLGSHHKEDGEMSTDSLSHAHSSTSQSSNRNGLSKYYIGKSQSFTSISEVASVEDLAKKQTPYRPSKSSYAGWLDDVTQLEPPQAIANKGTCSRGSCASAAARSSNRPPNIPLQKNF